MSQALLVSMQLWPLKQVAVPSGLSIFVMVYDSASFVVRLLLEECPLVNIELRNAVQLEFPNNRPALLHVFSSGPRHMLLRHSLSAHDVGVST